MRIVRVPETAVKIKFSSGHWHCSSKHLKPKVNETAITINKHFTEGCNILTLFCSFYRIVILSLFSCSFYCMCLVLFCLFIISSSSIQCQRFLQNRNRRMMHTFKRKQFWVELKTENNSGFKQYLGNYD